MDRLSFEPLSTHGLPPLLTVDLAADLGCRYISTWLTSNPMNPYGWPPFSLKDDAVLRREMIAAMRDKGVSISLIDGFFPIRPGADAGSLARDFEVAQELGVPRINCSSFEFDLPRTFDQLAKLVEMAEAVGIETVVEFVPSMAIPDLATAVAAVRHVGRPSFRVLVDTMHFVRGGGSAADLAAVDPELIGYVHFSDAPLAPTMPNYLEEAVMERLAPGKGELPLRDILSAVPRDVIISLEVPSQSQAEAGMMPLERLRPAVEATRRLLAELDG